MRKGFERFLLFNLAISQSISLFSQSPSLTTLPDSWIPKGSIQRVTTGGGNAYISGSFDWAGPYVGGEIFFYKATFTLDQTFPIINGTLSSVITDGNGGWFIGRDTKAGGVSVRNLVHILANKSIDPIWTQSINQGVESLFISSGRLYVGGRFTMVGRISYVEAVDLVA